ncbi:MAG: hypothetical protein JJE51_09850 [Thermoanaerobaculia bacterium]|nr:hypothetical protein [Thermoanaerobaculia bacterium]
MSSAGQTELHASQIITQIEAGGYDREVVLNVAKGFLPLPQEDLIAVLAYLIAFPDPEIAELSRASLSDMPARAVHGFAANEQAEPNLLAYLLRATTNAAVLELLIRNRSVDDREIAELARNAEGAVQEIIVINQARIIRSPFILDALLDNPHLTIEARRRALETREEFFEKKARIEALRRELGDDVVVDLSDDPIADLLELALKDTTPPAETLPDAPDDERGRSVYSRILKMNVAEKVQLAFKGDKTVRTLLVRERNRIVASAAMRNPRMTTNEIEAIAGMRNVEEEVLRLIGMKREWTTQYGIALALIKNPKAPVGVVLPLINRLTLRDLKFLKDDRGVSEAVRVNARKFYLAKQK